MYLKDIDTSWCGISLIPHCKVGSRSEEHEVAYKSGEVVERILARHAQVSHQQLGVLVVAVGVDVVDTHHVRSVVVIQRGYDADQ